MEEVWLLRMLLWLKRLKPPNLAPTPRFEAGL